MQYFPKFFSLGAKSQHFLFHFLERDNLITEIQDDADFILLPFGYEFVVEYKSQDLEKMGLGGLDDNYFKNIAIETASISEATGKPIIIVYYRDSTDPIPIKNAIVFRTSSFNGRKNEFGLPAFVAPKESINEWQPLTINNRPGVSFRGQAAPLVLPSIKSKFRFAINELVESWGFQKCINEYYSPGYVTRRRAVLAFNKYRKKFDLDFVINPNAKDKNYSNSFLECFNKYPYFLIAAGHGNYSYRLYETMREGRIPVFINTNCLMPCTDTLDWKKLSIWTEEANIKNLPERILDFHHSIHPDDFCHLQIQIRNTYQNYLTPEGFYRYFLDFLASKTTATKSIH